MLITAQITVSFSLPFTLLLRLFYAAFYASLPVPTDTRSLAASFGLKAKRCSVPVQQSMAFCCFSSKRSTVTGIYGSKAPGAASRPLSPCSVHYF